MKLTSKIKKITAAALMGAILFMSANTLSVQAQTTIDKVTTNSPGYGTTRTADGSGVNVRNAPNLTNSSIIVSIPNNTFLMIVGEDGDFYEVQYDDKKHYGYVSKDYLIYVARDYYLQANTSDSGLNMRATDSASGTPLTTIPRGTYFAYLSETSNGWYRGVYGNVTGYTSGEYTLRIKY